MCKSREEKKVCISILSKTIHRSLFSKTSLAQLPALSVQTTTVQPSLSTQTSSVLMSSEKQASETTPLVKGTKKQNNYVSIILIKEQLLEIKS